MSLKLIDSGDGQRTYDSSKWDGLTRSVTWAAAPSGQTGTWFQMGTGTGSRWADVNYTGDTLILGYRVELPATNTNPGVARALAEFGELTGGTYTRHVYIYLDSSGNIEVRRGGDGGTVIATGSVPLPYGSGCRYLEFKVKVHDSAGTVEVRLDETTILLNATGLDTRNGGTAKCNWLKVQGQAAGGNMLTWKFRDVYICGTDGSVNNDFRGVTKTGVKTVSGAGNSAQFTPSAGSNYQNVDDGTTVDNDTTYNGSSTVNHVDTFALTSSGLVSGAVIIGTQTNVILRKDDVDPRSAATVIRRSSTDYPQTTLSLGTTFVLNREIQENDPSTAVPWTQSGLDAAELGYKVIA